MNVYPSDDGRAAPIRLERGSDVVRSLDEAAGELGIHGGTVQGHRGRVRARCGLLQAGREALRDDPGVFRALDGPAPIRKQEDDLGLAVWR
jgi:hypothetical protein